MRSPIRLLPLNPPMPDDTALLQRHFDTDFAHEYAWKRLAQDALKQELMGALGGQ